MNEDYTDYFNESAPPEPEHESWRGVPSSPSASASSASNEPEQVPVWVKLVDVSDEIKQGYRPICVYMNEPPPVTFTYVFHLMGLWIGASLLWAAIIAAPIFLLMSILAALGVVR